MLARFAARWPDLPIVVDHAAKLFAARGELDPWRDDITRLADLGVHCKLSGLRTEQGPGNGRRPRPLRPSPCRDLRRTADVGERMAGTDAVGRRLWPAGCDDARRLVGVSGFWYTSCSPVPHRRFLRPATLTRGR
ncbi:amidohydrolase family protein [Sphingomonas sp. MMS24-JH45]